MYNRDTLSSLYRRCMPLSTEKRNNLSSFMEKGVSLSLSLSLLDVKERDTLSSV